MLITIVSSCTYLVYALVGCSSSCEEECIFSSSEVCPHSRAGEWVFPVSEVKFIHVKGNGSSLQMNLGKGAEATSRAATSGGAHCHWCGCSLAEARSLVTIRGGGCVLRVSLPGVTPCMTPSHRSAVPRGRDLDGRNCATSRLTDNLYVYNPTNQRPRALLLYPFNRVPAAAASVLYIDCPMRGQVTLVT